MYFRITIPSLQDGKKDEAITFVKDKVMPEFDGTPGLISVSYTHLTLPTTFGG